MPRKFLTEQHQNEWGAMYREIKNMGVFNAPQGFLKEVPLQDVRLHEDSIHGRAQQTNLEYLLMLDVDSLLWSFRKTAGLATPGKPYGGWEAPNIELRGHFVGNFLSIKREWSASDRLTLQLPLTLRTEAIKDDRPEYASIQAILYGPYLLAGHTNGGDWDLKAGANHADWIVPIPASYNRQLVSFSQDLEDSTYVLANSNHSLAMQKLPESGTDLALQATFRLVLEESFSKFSILTNANATSFVTREGLSRYNPISFVAKGANRNFLLEPLFSFRDEHYTVYFSIQG
uniref:Non-reducing end beta-L-arabinofuranosidase-like GH127 catalytic domain-containing protein n=1 Tax=Cajanus cajan TaxID=3821 RepID=A0A151TVW4_CAJCA|nr:hypothetical protein KK1_010392 [Cajanus cajan]